MAKEKQVIRLGYEPKPFWAKVIHPALDRYRWSVIVAHRRFGKTVGTINQMIRRALQNKEFKSPNYIYMAPFLSQAKMVAWEYLKQYTSKIPNRKINESELWVELPSYYPDARGARIHIKGADRPDALRGIYIDGIILDEYAQMKSEMWGEIVQPALSDHHGWAIFIGTPKGQNAFYDMYLKACQEDEWFSCLYTVDETGIIDEKELKAMKSNMTPTEVRQELYCDFTASNFDILIPMESVLKAIEKGPVPAAELSGVPRVMGVDVARFGDDACVIFKRQGRATFPPVVIKEIDNMTFASIVAKHIEDWAPDNVFIDAGRGEGVIDRLRQLGYNDKVVEVPFGGKAMKDTRYVNKRAEMWDEIRLWLEQGGHLNCGEYNSVLRKELTSPTYTFDGQNRIKLESKESIKERLNKSPDIADALCLTFAAPTYLSRNKMYKRNRKKGMVRHYGGM